MSTPSYPFWSDKIIFPCSDGNCGFLGGYPHRVTHRPKEWFSVTRMPYLVVELVDGEWISRAAQETIVGARRYADAPNRWIVFPVDKNLF